MNKPYESYNIDDVGAKVVSELEDVQFTNLLNNQILIYDKLNQIWINQTPGGIDTVSSLTDTNITNLSDNQILRYDSTTSKWLNETLTDVDTIQNLSDTNITSLANSEILKYNSTSGEWQNSPHTLLNLNDVTITSLANGEILKYNSSSGIWVNNLVLINEIGDVNITSLQNGEVLKYNSTTSKWENANNTDTLNELSDVVITSIQNNNVLKYNSTSGNFINTFINLTELADTNITTLNNGNILRYNNSNTAWETSTFTINDLDNVNITSLANNEVLKYNSTSGNWENSNRIDTLNELGDVTLSASLAAADLLRYNGTNFVNVPIKLDNDFANVNFTSLSTNELIKYDGTNFINFAPTYLDGAGISNNYLIKVVSGATTQTSITETNTTNTTNITFNNGSIETEIFNTTKKRMHLTTGGIASTNGITITSDGRVGIGVVEPEENFELDGNIQLDTGGVQRGRVIFYDKQNDHEHAEVDGLGEGTNGGSLAFYTKVDGGSVTEKLRINNKGAIGIAGATYGTANQVLVSNGSNSSVAWTNQTDTTYGPGTGVTLSGTTFSIGQSVGTTDSPTFSSISAATFEPSYTTLPTLTGKIGQIVDAGTPTVTLVVNNSIQVRSLTIPYTGVWLIGMSLVLGNALALTGAIIYPTSISINGSVTHNFYGTNVTGVHGTITRNLSVNNVISFNTFLSGSGASSMTATQRAVWGTGYTFLTATRIA